MVNLRAYIVSNSENGMDNVNGVYYLITEKGEVLDYHWCSNKGFAMWDLYNRRPERIEEWLERFGELTVDYLGCDDVTMEEIMKLNEKWRKEHEGDDEYDWIDAL